jgi:hypothetical protein
MPFVFLLELLAVICAIWVIYDVWTNSKKDPAIKILLTILALAFSILTAIVYFLTKKR